MKREADGLEIRMRTIVVDCRDAARLAAFYSGLLGWPVTAAEPDWVLMRDPAGGTGLAFQAEADYEPPVWPEQPGAQQKMLHPDFLVRDLEAAVAHAQSLGAAPAPVQELAGVRVMLDPEGHPFCLFTDEGYVWQ